ncbi:MAG TPA: recombinase family protein, partial [Ktedonobacteraceae bacterium]|nr:recombinase family protein [Ktedonobacteraceae bacterium]
MNIAVYVRVSTQRQAQAQTIEQQLDSLRKHHEAQGLAWQEEYIFRDDGYSGAKLRRPGLDRLREQVGRAAFDKVIITAPDRLARNYVHQMLLIEEFERGGCQVEFVDRPMSHDPHDQLLLQIRGAVSEYERSLIAERMRRGRRQKYLAGGLLPWTRAPYGYRVDPARPRDPAGVRLEATEAAVVAELFSNYLQEGKSLKAETQRLTNLDIPSPVGKTRWNQATIRGILTNPVYTGTVYIGRSRPTEARGRHSALVPIGRGRGGHVQTSQEEWTAVTQVPAIISQEQFDLVQAKLAHNQQFARRNNTAYPYLLRALVSCGTCRLGCIGRSSRGGYAYYVCVGRSHGTISHRDEKCPARSIPVEQLDELVWQDVCEMLTHPDRIASALYRAQGGQWLPQELQARRENLRKARVSLEQQMERLTDAYLANVLQLEEFKRRKHELEQRLSVITEQKRQLEANVGHHDQLAGMVQSIEAFCQRVQQGISEATFEQKRQLIELLVDRVVVTGEEVEIRYVIPTSPKGETIRFCHLRLDYFDVPMGAQEVQKPMRVSLLRRQAGEAIDDLLGTFEPVRDAPTDDEDLSGTSPLSLKEGTQQGRRPDAPFLQTPMSLVPGVSLFPFVCLSLRIGEKGMDVLPEGGMILFDNQDVLAAKADHIGTKGVLGMQSICGHNAIFDECGAEPARQRTDLIVFLFDCPMGQDQSTLWLIPGDDMHPWLMLLGMGERSPQCLPIHRHLLQGRRGPCLAPFLLGSGFEKDCCHYLDQLLRITIGERSGHSRIAGKPPGPVQVFLEQMATQVHPLQRSVKR